MLGKSSDSGDALTAAIVSTIVFGSGVVTLNAKLIGLKHSIFFYLSVMGYCLAPFLVAALISLLLSSFITRFGVMLASLACLGWSLRASSVFFSLTLDPRKRMMALYPLTLFYVFFAVVIALH